MGSQEGTDSLRSLASHWSLAGDDKLLEILQNTHKQIISKCQKVNSQLSEMATTLDDASISLQNVNNKFMALSNSQFIESRVYDDDVDITMEPVQVKESPKPVTQESNLTMLRKSLEVLESMHELVTILRDSDTESDTDDDDVARVVLKPKDLYADRPLPYIIGSQAWKSKWHAGLIVEDSDSDSTVSKPDKHLSEYSDSEPEDSNLQTDKPDVTISETSSELASEQDTPHLPTNKQTPSDIAAELARRLGGQPTAVINPEEDVPSPPKPIVKTVYRPQQPPTGTIFSDEPPPIDNYQSDSSPEDDDIFAELHKNKPNTHSDRDQIRVGEDLFGLKKETENVGGYIFNDFAKDQILPNTTAIQNPTLFDEESDPELFADNVQSIQNNVESKSDKPVKKPIGGISVFGTNKGAESIGAAIMKRNTRKPSSSDESENEEHITARPAKNTDQTDSFKKEKDIFNDLFAKSEKKDTKKDLPEVKEEKAKVDLFSDNLFDDIDDIFSTNVVTMPKKQADSNKKSIFDDEDDLFADIAGPSVVSNETKVSKSKTINMFDSDDELFSEKSTTIIDDRKSTNKVPSPNEVKQIVTPKKLEDNSIDLGKNNNNTGHINTISKNSEITKTEDNVVKVTESTKDTKVTKSIFDSDSDSDIFSNINIKSSKTSPKSMDDESDTKEVISVTADKHQSQKHVLQDEPVTIENKNIQNLLKINDELKKYKSPSLFDDDDDLFNDSVNSNSVENMNGEIEKTFVIQPVPLFESKLLNVEEKNMKNVVMNSEKISNPVIETKHRNASEDPVLEKPVENPVKIENKEGLYINHVKNIYEESVQSADTPITKSQKNKTEQKDTETQSSINNDYHSDKIKDVFLEQNDVLSNDNIFGEIVSEPPEFEKPKEPKKSKNVNALFDDDSDDEALFFRKSDVIDENPEDFSPSVNQDNLFGIFHDEPPALDIDFNSNAGEQRDDFGNFNDSDSELFSSISKQEKNIVDTEKISTVTKINEKIYTSLNKQTKPQNLLDKDNFDDLNNDTLNKTENVFIAKTKLETGFAAIPNTIKNTEIPVSSSEQIYKPPNVLVSNDSDEELFSTLAKPEKPKLASPHAEVTDKQTLFNQLHESCENLFNSVKTEETNAPEQVLNTSKINKSQEPIGGNIPISKQEDNNNSLVTQINDFNKSESELVVQPHKDIGDDVDFTQIKSGNIKKIGRIKSMNFNIDVNALLPGASPKKQKPAETLNNNGESNENVEVKIPNLANKSTDESVSSEKSESKLIKSISFDSEPNSEILDNKVSKYRAKIQVKRRPSTRRARREAARKSVIDIDDSTDNSSSIDDAPKNVDTEKEINSELVNKVAEKPLVTSKIVYILNDEDIFDTKPERREETDKNVIEKPLKNISKPENTDFNSSVNTLGKVYNEESNTRNSSDNSKYNININETENIKTKLAKKSIFDELSDDDNELFETKRKTSKKPSLFDSDDENIFTGKSNTKVLKKGSLFGDDEDNDLFGVKTKVDDVSRTQTSKPSTSKEPVKSTQLVFEDPLSMLENDD